MAIPAEEIYLSSQNDLPEISDRYVTVRGRKIGNKCKTKCPICNRRTVRIRCESTGVYIPSPRCEKCNVRVVLIDPVSQVSFRQPKKRKSEEKRKPHHVNREEDEDVENLVITGKHSPF